MKNKYLRNLFFLFPIVVGFFIFLGFYLHTDVLSQPKGMSLAIYQILQLYVLESDPEILKSSWMILLGSFLAPASLASAIIFNLFEFGRTAMKLFYIRLFLKDHIIIAGDDPYTRGLLASENTILYIRSKVADLNKDMKAGKNVLELKSDLFSSSIWRKCNLKKCKAVIISLDNVASAPRICEMMANNIGRSNQPPVYFALDSDEEYEVVSDGKNMLAGSIFGFIRGISMKRMAASVLVEKNAPHNFFPMQYLSENPVHLVFYGFNDFTEKILLESAQYYIYPNTERMIVTIVTDKSDQIDDLMKMYPGIKNVIDLYVYTDTSFDKYLRFDADYPDNTMPLHIYFSPDNNWMIHTLVRRWKRFLFNRYGDTSYKISLSFILSNKDQHPDIHKSYLSFFPEDNVEIFCESDLISIKKILTEETFIDSIGRNIHERYASKYHIESWDQLTQRKKEFNRRSARHLTIKLAYLGFSLEEGKSNEPHLQNIPQPDDKIMEILAEMEHRRWMIEKYLDDFLPGSDFSGKRIDKNIKAKLRIHDDLKSFDQLYREDIEKDLDTFRDWWALIGEVLSDKRIVRISDV